MKHCFGITNSSPAVVFGQLKEKGIVQTLKLHSVGDVLTSKSKVPKGDLLFLTFEDFVLNLKTLNSSKYTEVNAFVFASPIRLNELRGIHLLDMEDAPGSLGFGFRLHKTPKYTRCKSILKKKGGSEVSVVNVNVLETITTNIKKGSILTPLMTFLYSLPSATLQTPVKYAVARILVENKPLKSLDKVIKSVSEYELSVLAKNRLVSILESDASATYREAFKYRLEATKPIGPTALAKKFGIDPYEISYLLSVVYPKESK